MTPEKIGEVREDRFARWGRFFRDQDATPSVVIGLGWPGRLRGRHEIIITCPEEVTDDQVVEQLAAAIALIRAGRRRDA